MQRRTFEFQADDLTNDLNASISGLVDAGVYRGFDSIDYVQGSLWIDFNHDITAFPYFDNGTTHGACGLVVTPKGCRIVETTRVRVSFSLSNPNITRVHALVCEHLRIDTAGGNIANYYFQDPTDPINGDMVHIGNLYEFSDGSLIWERNTAKLLGGRSIETENLSKAMWREKSLVALIDARGRLEITEGASIFDVQGEDKTIYSLPNFSNSLGTKTGASIILKALSSFKISDKNPIPVLPFNSVEKPINLGGEDEIEITTGGFVELLEGENFWHVKNIWTTQMSSASLYHRLSNMDEWGFLEDFRTSVHYTLRKKETTVVTNGLIETSNKHRFIEVTVEEGEEVWGFSQPFAVGSEVVINFIVTTGEAYLKNFVGNSIAKFKTFNSFDGILKGSSIVKGIQLSDRFLVTEFEALEIWQVPISSSLPIQNSVYGSPFGFRKRIDGFVEFRGSIITPLEDFSFTISRDLFPNLEESVYEKEITIPPLRNINDTKDSVRYKVDSTIVNGVPVFGNTITFTIVNPTDNTESIEYNFDYILMSYK